METGKRCLIVVDYQKDFVDGSLGFEKAVTLDHRIAEKIHPPVSQPRRRRDVHAGYAQ